MSRSRRNVWMHGTCVQTHAHIRMYIYTPTPTQILYKTHKRGIWNSLHKVETKCSIQPRVIVRGSDGLCHSCPHCSSLQRRGQSGRQTHIHYIEREWREYTSNTTTNAAIICPAWVTSIYISVHMDPYIRTYCSSGLVQLMCSDAHNLGLGSRCDLLKIKGQPIGGLTWWNVEAKWKLVTGLWSPSETALEAKSCVDIWDHRTGQSLYQSGNFFASNRSVCFVSCLRIHCTYKTVHELSLSNPN